MCSESFATHLSSLFRNNDNENLKREKEEKEKKEEEEGKGESQHQHLLTALQGNQKTPRKLNLLF